MLIGIISKIISEKRIGFIKPYAPGGDVFFHFSVVAGVPAEQLQEGQAVGFEFDKLEGTRTRPRASKVEPCDRKLLGATSVDEVPPVSHPRARHRKPTWRR